MSIHPLVLATIENMRTRAELRAEVLRSQRESTTTASTSGQSQALAIGRRLREADAIAGSWLRVLAAVTETAEPRTAEEEEEFVPDPPVCEVSWHTHQVAPVTEACVRSVPEETESAPAPKRRKAVNLGDACYDIVCRHARNWHPEGGGCVVPECMCARFLESPAEARKARVDSVVGYRLGKRLRCVQHPFSSMRDTAVTAQELEDGGFCELAECGRDLLA